MEQVQQLSLRLQTIAREVPEGARLADIGTDHAQLPVALVADGHICAAVASDAKAGPFQTALRNVATAGLTADISVRHGEGLHILETADDVDVIVIAGMGGSLITEILSAGNDMPDTVQRLILQPNVAADIVRKWLYHGGWSLKSEHIVQEEEQFYEVLTADKGSPGSVYENKDWDDAIMFGPHLLESKPGAFHRKWEQELAHMERVLQQMNAAHERAEIALERERIHERINKIKEVLT
ncbi:tRNA (adenine(22)-N(1))-methyltransferase [Natribacillus halophilus]|uniref:tRNA (Adenine22-N1)-methyltransferase n=1 Tax=Natribacillus halophilus TaxID=549003 RepID=A0A1G8JR59_9BACI|nr:tRNA (adenine(22)-N(1))-methyltransferase TrmK [Natribacillus halophilus]SDI33744.1 tRNA (adenine22-N1)-methyltransferase [Natribacillus halophilus]